MARRDSRGLSWGERIFRLRRRLRERTWPIRKSAIILFERASQWLKRRPEEKTFSVGIISVGLYLLYESQWVAAVAALAAWFALMRHFAQTDADRQRRIMEKSVLKRANLRGARLERANLRHARLENADLIRAHLDDVDAFHAKGLSDAQLLFTTGDGATKLPARLRQIPKWAVRDAGAERATSGTGSSAASPETRSTVPRRYPPQISAPRPEH